MPRERHQNGWVVASGTKIKKWIGHWRPYREDGTRSHSTVVLGLKSKMKKWEAEDALRAHIAKVEKQPLRHPDGEPTLKSFWEHSYLPSRTWGPATKSAVVSVVSHHLLPMFGDQKLKALDKLMLQQHLNKLAESFSRSLVKKILVQLRAILGEAVDQDLILKSPARKLVMPSTPRPCGRFLSLLEFQALIASMEFRDRLMVRMACSMGFRPGELFALRWDDVEDARIRVDESASRWGVKEPKTEGSKAWLPMPATVREQMQIWRELHRIDSPAALVFSTSTGKPISAHNYERDVIVPAAIRAGIMAKPSPERQKGAPKREKATAVNFQAFRRTFATWMQRTGATVKDVQGAMRHSSPDQTLKAYMQEISGGVRTAVEDLDRLLNQDQNTPKGSVQ